MTRTVGGYFTIVELSEFLRFATKSHLTENAQKYGAQSGTKANCTISQWNSEVFRRHETNLFNLAEIVPCLRVIERVRLLSDYYAAPDAAVTVAGILNNQTVIETHGLDITLLQDYSNGIRISARPDTRKNFLVWNYLEGDFESQLERHWLPERDSKLQVLQERRAYPPIR